MEFEEKGAHPSKRGEDRLRNSPDILLILLVVLEGIGNGFSLPGLKSVVCLTLHTFLFLSVSFKIRYPITVFNLK